MRLLFGGVALSKEQSTETTIVRHEAIPVRALGGGVWKVDEAIILVVVALNLWLAS